MCFPFQVLIYDEKLDTWHGFCSTGHLFLLSISWWPRDDTRPHLKQYQDLYSKQPTWRAYIHWSSGTASNMSLRWKSNIQKTLTDESTTWLQSTWVFSCVNATKCCFYLLSVMPNDTKWRKRQPDSRKAEQGTGKETGCKMKNEGGLK